MIMRVVAILFVSVTALLLILTVANVIDSTETREAIIKLAAISGIIAATAMAITFLGDNKTK